MFNNTAKANILQTYQINLVRSVSVIFESIGNIQWEQNKLEIFYSTAV